MIPHETLFLFAAGIGGGTISALVGGASIVTFPTLLAAGLPPVLAAACNLIALTPGNFLAAMHDHTRLPPLDRSFAGLVVASVVGAGIGAGLLLLTPERTFTVLVPALLGFATVLFALAPRIGAWLRSRPKAKSRGKSHPWHRSIAAVLPISVYGGYFGAGVGVLLLGVISVGTGGDYRSANVTKNLVTSLNSLAASVVFVAQGLVLWHPTLVMMVGALLGSLVGGLIARVLPNVVARLLVITVGAGLTVIFAQRYWF